MNLYQKLVEVRKNIQYLKKDKRAYNYTYVSGTQVLSAIREKMDELGLLLVPSIVDSRYADLLDDKGKQDRLVCLKMFFSWINADDPKEKLEIPWQAMGQNSREKGIGCALTYAERYFLLKFFSVPTDDLDPDAYQAEAAEAAPKPVTEQNNEEIAAQIKSQLVRTGLGRDAIIAYCEANGIPLNAKDCNTRQLIAVRTHLMSLPDKK